MREVELGLVTEDATGETAQALERALGEPLNERERLSIRGARYVDFRLIPNFDRYHRKWRHDAATTSASSCSQRRTEVSPAHFLQSPLMHP